MHELERAAGLSTSQGLGDPGLSDLPGPLDQAPLHPFRRHHLVVNLLVDPWHGHLHRRPYDPQVVRDRLEGMGIGEDAPRRREKVVHHTLEHVRQGQEAQRHVIGLDAENAQTRRDVGEEVVVGQHDPLGVARRARSV